MTLLQILTPAQVATRRRKPSEPSARSEARLEIEQVRKLGFAALDPSRGPRELILRRSHHEAALEALPAEARGALERAAERIKSFALAQRQQLSGLRQQLSQGAILSLDYVPVARAGCYAPAGPSRPMAVLMNALTARAAGVGEVWIASPDPSPATLAAAAVAGADAFLACGGPRAVAALAYGADPIPACDVIVGPGDAALNAAALELSELLAIDLPPSESELVLIADESVKVELVVADILSHLGRAASWTVVLMSLSRSVIVLVESALKEALMALPVGPAKALIEQNLSASYAVVLEDHAQGAELCNRLAPDRLALVLRRPAELRARLRHVGALFVGGGAAPALADYGAGFNGVLPAGGLARSQGAHSILRFLRPRPCLEALAPNTELARDAAILAQLESGGSELRSVELRK
jgi:histidinol dehydrogenase